MRQNSRIGFSAHEGNSHDPILSADEQMLAHFGKRPRFKVRSLQAIHVAVYSSSTDTSAGREK